MATRLVKVPVPHSNVLFGRARYILPSMRLRPSRNRVPHRGEGHRPAHDRDNVQEHTDTPIDNTKLFCYSHSK